MAPEQSRKQGHSYGNIKHAIHGVIKELAEEVDEKGRESLQKLWAKFENEEVQLEGIIAKIRTDEDAPDWTEKFLRKLHLVSEDTQVVSMEDRGLKGFDSSLNAKEKSENRPQRFKIKTINVGVVKEGGEDHK
nr:hypothetical protein Iba_chr04eCG14930 [Ipomoea batatas]